MAEENAALTETVSRELLPFVTNPAQYVGGEVNAVTKDWHAAAVRFCLAFPDTYAIGMSHLGSAIIYAVLNDRQDTLCERTYAPWPDAHDRMRQAGIPLFSWESRRPVREFDLVGFSLQYEMLYTNVLAMLSLGGIPPLAGFVGKFHLFWAAVEDSSLWWLVLLGALMSVVSLYYYLMVIRQMYILEDSPAERSPLVINPPLALAIWICVIATVAIGVWPRPLFEFALSAAAPMLPGG